MVTGLIAKLFERFLQRKEFVFRFDEYDGSEANKQVYEGQVVEYEFINAGSSICVIGSGLKLYPKVSGMEPYRVKLAVNYNETDVTVYTFKFIPLDLQVITDTQTALGAMRVDFSFVVNYSQLTSGATGKDIVLFNRLIVISKVKAKSVPRSIEPHGKENKKESR